MNTDQWKRAVALLALIAVPVLAPFLLRNTSSFHLPWGACVNVQIAKIDTSARFTLEALSRQGGHPVYSGTHFSNIEGASFCDDTDLPLSARGSTQLADSSKVWTVLRGNKGQFYLQYPPVDIKSGQWVAANIRPRGSVARIEFLVTDTKADTFFSARASHEDWDEFASLPSGVTPIGSITLTR